MSQAGEPPACLKCRRKSGSVAVRDEYYPFKLCGACCQAGLAARRGDSAPEKIRSQSVASVEGSLINEEESVVVHSQSTNTCSFIHDELLYFVQNQLDAGVTNDELVQITMDFYKEEEVFKSKYTLLNMLPKDSRPHQESKTRIGAGKMKQSVQDILHLMQHPQLCNASLSIRFVATYADRVPPMSFKTLDVSVLMSTLRTMQEEMFDIQRKFVRKDELMTLLGEQQLNEVRMPGHSYAQAARPPSQRSGQASAPAAQPSVGAPSLWWEGGQEQAGGDGQGLQSASTSTKPPAPTTYARAAAPQDEQGGWQVQSSRHRGHTSTQQANISSNSMQQYPAPAGMKQPGRPRSKTLVIGKSTDHRGHLKVVSRRIQLFVSRLDPSTTVEEVEQFVKGEMDIDISAEKRETRHESYSSFIIHCQLSQKDVLLDGTKWPNNTLVKPWYPPRPKAEKLQLPQEGDVHGQESGTTSDEK